MTYSQEVVERIVSCYQATNGNSAEAARRVGIAAATVRYIWDKEGFPHGPHGGSRKSLAADRRTFSSQDEDYIVRNCPRYYYDPYLTAKSCSYSPAIIIDVILMS